MNDDIFMKTIYKIVEQKEYFILKGTESRQGWKPIRKIWRNGFVRCRMKFLGRVF